MKRFILLWLSLIVVFSFISCSKGPGDVLEKVKSYHSSGDFENVKKFYTKGTVEAMDELEKLSPQSKGKGKNADKKFADGSKWEVVSEKIDGDTAEVKVKYVEHPVENMKGLELPFRLKKEDGEWKIDMEKEMRMGLNMIKQMGGGKDFFRAMKKYKK